MPYKCILKLKKKLKTIKNSRQFYYVHSLIIFYTNIPGLYIHIKLEQHKLFKLNIKKYFKFILNTRCFYPIPNLAHLKLNFKN